LSLTVRQIDLGYDVLRALNSEGFLLLEEILEHTGHSLSGFRGVLEKFRVEKGVGPSWRKRWMPDPLTKKDLMMVYDVFEQLVFLTQEDEEVEDFVRTDIGMHPEEVSGLAREILSAKRWAPE
jgi:hypothetical protein